MESGICEEVMYAVPVHGAPHGLHDPVTQHAKWPHNKIHDLAMLELR